MVDIQSATAENGRVKRKKKEERRRKIETTAARYNGLPLYRSIVWFNHHSAGDEMIIAIWEHIPLVI